MGHVSITPERFDFVAAASALAERVPAGDAMAALLRMEANSDLLLAGTQSFPSIRQDLAAAAAKGDTESLSQVIADLQQAEQNTAHALEQVDGSLVKSGHNGPVNSTYRRASDLVDRLVSICEKFRDFRWELMAIRAEARSPDRVTEISSLAALRRATRRSR